ncbi:hypothetical protein PV379_04830 [Streptomyces caniscabiei]|uniref:MAG6450 family protein n=1 Tax=Streptomyces caniscabiei TaxID=2746961 RepID=UPI0029B72AD4|nr:hypothetical protein [Streptomyces caniscabiei]MDX2776655.1 hypothetical protein [Streptomyces caniscabiei]
MNKQLTGQNTSNKFESVPLARVKAQPFKLCFQRSLDNQFNFKKMKQSGLKDLHDFIENTVGKGLDISQVDQLYLRKRGLGLNDEVHYGKDRHPFRIHGNFIDAHFVVSKIDCNHDVNK